MFCVWMTTWIWIKERKEPRGFSQRLEQEVAYQLAEAVGTAVTFHTFEHSWNVALKRICIIKCLWSLSPACETNLNDFWNMQR